MYVRNLQRASVGGKMSGQKKINLNWIFWRMELEKNVEEFNAGSDWRKNWLDGKYCVKCRIREQIN